MDQREIKISIGKMIKYYRKRMHKKTKKKRYTQKGILAYLSPEYLDFLENYGEPFNRKFICSSKTISAIENGDYFDSKSDIVYYGLAFNLDKKLDLSRRHANYFELLCKCTLTDIEWMRLSSLRASLRDLRSRKEHMENVLLYEEYYEVYEAVLLYFSEDQMISKDFVEKYTTLRDAFDEKTQCLLTYLFCKYYIIVDHNTEKIDKSIATLLGFKENNYFHMIASIYTYVQNRNSYSLLEYLNAIKESEYYKKNVNVQYVVNDYLALGMMNTNHKGAIKPLKKCVALIKENPTIFPESSHIRAYYHLGLHYHFNDEPQSALKYFKHLLKYKNTKFSAYPLLLLSTAEKLQLNYVGIKEIIDLLAENKNYAQGHNKIIIEYFRLKYQKSVITKNEAMRLEERIVEDILPYYVFKSETYCLFEQQLIELANISGRYKLAMAATVKNDYESRAKELNPS